MRRQKEVDMTNLSFLDMITGSLGAVLILFIIIPKVSFKDLKDLKVVQGISSIQSSQGELNSTISKLQNLIPESDYKDLINKSAKLQGSINSLRSATDYLQDKLNKRNDEYDKLADKYYQLLNETDKSESHPVKSIQPTNLPNETSYNPTVTTQAPKENYGEGDAIIGINPPLAIYIEWENKKNKVHLYMKNKATGAWCYNGGKKQQTPFGLWTKAFRKYTIKPNEAIIQKDEIVPGDYDIYVYAKTKSPVDVSGFISMKLGDNPVNKIEIQSFKPTQGRRPTTGDQSTLIGTLRVTSDNIIWNPK